MIKVKTFVFNPFMENTYLLYDEAGKTTVIDPGCYHSHEITELDEFVSNEQLEVVQLVNTHCHIDHVLGNEYVSTKYKVGLGIHSSDLETLRAVKAYAPAYGFEGYREKEPDHFIEEGSVLKVGETEFQVIFAPGHSPGHIVFFSSEEGFLIGGDVLFRDSIGRTDLPGGDHDLLIRNIREKLFVLPDDTLVYPGHGEVTTIGYEKMNNPFCAIR